MKTFFKPLFFLLAIMLSGSAVMAQKSANLQYLFKGKLVDADSGVSVSFAHVRNYYKSSITTSNQDGAFTMPVQGGDTLLITRIGYTALKYAVPIQEPMGVTTILVQPKTEELKEVVITQFPTESKFKDQLLKLELPEEGIALRLPPPPPISNNSIPEGDVSIVSISGAISGFANKFNDKERGRQFKIRMDLKEQRDAVIATKFNKDIAQQITGLKDGAELNEFMEFCVLQDDFLYNANQYEIHEAVLGCFKDFVASR